jgi:toxin-antitoxin system PIN domain toxin
MRSLLDVNVLVALLDADHSQHARAARWLAGHAAQGWASCPITQNGCVRAMSHPGYPNPLPAGAVIERLAEACARPEHSFWPDDLSLLDGSVVDAARIHGPRQLTDLYLLALAVRRGGRFVTFDGTIARAAVNGAQPRHLMVV